MAGFGTGRGKGVRALFFSGLTLAACAGGAPPDDLSPEAAARDLATAEARRATLRGDLPATAPASQVDVVALAAAALAAVEPAAGAGSAPGSGPEADAATSDDADAP